MTVSASTGASKAIPDQTRLIQLTDGQAIEQTHRENHRQWGANLEIEDYLLREKGCKAKLTSESTQFTNWGLQIQDKSSEKWQTVSAFESQRRLAYIKRKGKPVKTTINHSIGAVFTPERYRGRGYAAQMLANGTEKLLTWQVPNDMEQELRDQVLLTLWSDIKHYYSKFGYEKVSTDILVFRARADKDFGTPKVELIDNEDDLARLAIGEQELFKKLLDNATEEDGVTRIAIIPSITAFHYANWRAIFQGPLISGPKETPQIFGAKTKHSWVLWSHDFPSNKLYILRSHTDLPDEDCETIKQEFAQLMAAAISEAQKWQFPDVHIWRQDLPYQLNNTSAEKCTNSGIDLADLAKYLQSSGLEVKVEDRDGSWPCWNARENTEWSFAGKYCWF